MASASDTGPDEVVCPECENRTWDLPNDEGVVECVLCGTTWKPTGPIGVLRTGAWADRPLEHLQYEDAKGVRYPHTETEDECLACRAESGWWVNVSRVTPTEEFPDVALGPYVSKEAAESAMQDSLLVESEIQDGCDDCWVADNGRPAEGHRLVLIDPNDPHHNGGGE